VGAGLAFFAGDDGDVGADGALEGDCAGGRGHFWLGGGGDGFFMGLGMGEILIYLYSSLLFTCILAYYLLVFWLIIYLYYPQVKPSKK
jgi:hypothetical protein